MGAVLTMSTLYDHRTTPPAAYIGDTCVLIPGVGSVPVSNPPPGIYQDGGADPVPAGKVAKAWGRVVREGKSVAVPELEDAPPTPPDPRPELVARIKAALALLGMTPATTPTDFVSSIDALKALPDKVAACAAGLELLALRTALIEAGGSWRDVTK